MHMLHLGDSEDDEMEFSDVPSPRASSSAAAPSSAAAAQSHSGTRPRPLSSEAVEDVEDGEGQVDVVQLEDVQLVHAGGNGGESSLILVSLERSEGCTNVLVTQYHSLSGYTIWYTDNKFKCKDKFQQFNLNFIEMRLIRTQDHN